MIADAFFSITSKARGDPIAPSRTVVLHAFVIAGGIISAVLFVLVGLVYELQEYGDASIFSYAVAVQDSWAFHWHNITARMFVYLFSFWPAETYVGLTGDARGGIMLYGLLFFSAQLLGLGATFAADRSKGLIVFAYACASTACLCPLVFGAPTEMWMAHALFWPALALCHFARNRVADNVLVFVVLLALVLTHEGALVFAFAIWITVLLRGWQDAAFVRTTAALMAALAIWGAVKLTLRPDSYYASIIPWAEFNFISYRNFDNDLVRLLAAALAGYSLVLMTVRRLSPKCAALVAGIVVAAALAVYWLAFDHSLYTQERYFMRTALLFATPALGALAALYALRADDRLRIPIPLLPRLLTALASNAVARAAIGALALVMLVHAVETAKFVIAWNDYKAAIETLATGSASDPSLGDPRFVSADRIRADLHPVSWQSTTSFLSVLVVPGFAPSRLVVNPEQDYFWISCRTAKVNEDAKRAIPVESRRLIRIHACLHRPK